MKSLSNLVKHRFVVEDIKTARVINSNEKMSKIIGKRNDMNGFTQGLFAEQVEVSCDEDMVSDEEEVFGLKELMDENREEITGELPEETPQISEISIDELREREADMLENIKQEALLEAENIKQQAYEEGKRQAEEELAEMKDQLLKDTTWERERLQGQYFTMMEEMEPQLVDTILSLVDDVLHVEIKDYRDIIIQLIKETISDSDSPKEMSIVVNDENYQMVKEELPALKEMVGEEVKLEIMKNGQLSNGECRIETEYGIFECGFDTQFRNLSNRLRVLSRQRDEE